MTQCKAVDPGDTVTVGFSGALQPSSVCTGLTSGGYYGLNGGSTLTLNSSSLAYNSTSHALTLTLGTPQSGNSKPVKVTSSTLTLTLTPNGILDSGGSPLTGYTFTGSPGPQL